MHPLSRAGKSVGVCLMAQVTSFHLYPPGFVHSRQKRHRLQEPQSGEVTVIEHKATGNILSVHHFHLLLGSLPVNRNCRTHRWGPEAGVISELQESHQSSTDLATLPDLVKWEHSHSHLETLRSCPACDINLRRKH